MIIELEESKLNDNQNIISATEKNETDNSNNLKTSLLKTDPAENLSNSEDYKEKIKYYEKRERELMIKYDASERTLELERLNSSNIQRELNEKLKELKEKEKALLSITATNSKLMATLETLKKDLDEKFDKVSFKQLTDKMKPVKDNPLDIVLKVKEKELKNTLSLLEILKKDNENLKRNMNEQININSYIDLQNKLKYKETQISELTNEIKALSRSSEEHNKCHENKKEYENEKKNLRDEIKKLKDIVREMQFKLKEEEAKHSKTKDNLINLKKQFEDSKRSLLVIKPNSNNVGNNQNQNFLSERNDITEKIKKLNHDENITDALLGNNNNLENVANTNAKKARDNSSAELRGNVNNMKILGLKNKNIEKLKIRETSSNPKFASNKNKLNEQNLKEKLFNAEEKSNLEKVISSEDIERFEKKYEYLDHAKQAIENKLKLENKILQKKLAEKEDQNEYLNLQYKESEQKNKIFQFQVNEYKNEQKALHRKINDMQTNLSNLYSIIRENNQENKLLTNQLTSLRKLVKHNAVPPMDSEIVKHLEKIKSSSKEEQEDLEIKKTNISFDKEIEKIHNNLDVISNKGKGNSIKLDESKLNADGNFENENKESNLIGDLTSIKNSQTINNNRAETLMNQSGINLKENVEDDNNQENEIE